MPLRQLWSRCRECYQLMVIDVDTEIVYCGCPGFQVPQKKTLDKR